MTQPSKDGKCECCGNTEVYALCIDCYRLRFRAEIRKKCECVLHAKPVVNHECTGMVCSRCLGTLFRIKGMNLMDKP